MALDAVQKNKSNSMSYIKATAIGALTGYSLKYILPISPQEKDENFKASLKCSRHKAQKAKLAAIENIKNSKNKSAINDTFIRMYDKKQLKPSLINKLENHLRGEIVETIKKVNEVTKIEKLNSKKDLIAITKSIRPTGAFVAIGFIFGFVVALINNISNKISAENSQLKDV